MRTGRIASSPQPRRSGLMSLFGLALLVLPASHVPAQARDILTVTMDKAKLLKYPPNTETIIIGNPIIADVTMLRSSGILVVTGKGYGETNLLLLDRGGTVISEASLRVEPSDALLVVQRGTDRESYSCNPRCEPTVSIGDASSFFTSSTTAITSRNNLAAPAGGGAAH